MTIRPGVPIELSEFPDTHFSVSEGLSEEARKEARKVGATLKAYLLATRALLDGKYSTLRQLAPVHMTEACRPIVFAFPDGILIRYDRQENPELKVLVGTPMEGSLTDLAPTISESFLHCPAEVSGYDPGDRTIKFTLHAQPVGGGDVREIMTQRIFAVSSIIKREAPDNTNSSTRPIPLISVRNEFDFMMEIELEPNDTGTKSKFLTRNRFRAPVGWEAIELYPHYQAEIWNPDLAPLWAENDLLAAVLQRNIREDNFRAIDPNAHARKRMARLLSDYDGLLNGNEEPLHQFIKANPQLLSPAYQQMWSKLSLGKRDTDFVFRQPAGDYLLVELEKPSLLLFRDDGQQRVELTHAIDQIIDWRRYIEDNLATVQRELGLVGISSNPSCLVVIGRSSSLSDDDRRKLTTIQNMIPKIKIMTYDDVLANAKATAENILGPIWDAGPHAEVYLLP